MRLIDKGYNAPNATSGTTQWVDLETGGVSGDLGATWDYYGDRGESWTMACSGILWDLYDASNDSHDPQCADAVVHGADPAWNAVAGGMLPRLCIFYDTYNDEANPSHNAGIQALINGVFCTHGYNNTHPLAIHAACYPVTGNPTPLEEAVSDGIRITPNPSRGSVAFALEPGVGANGLEVFDIRGRRVWRCRKVTAGTVSWNGMDEHGHPLEAGVYFVSFWREGRRNARPMLIIR